MRNNTTLMSKSKNTLQSLFRKWKSLRARSQLFLILFGISIIVLLVSLLLFCIVNIFLIETLGSASEQLMIMEIQRQAFRVRILHKRNAELYLRRAASSIINLNNLYNSISKSNIITEQPYDCLNNPLLRDAYQFNSSFCYGIFGVQQLSDQDQQFIKFTGMINSFVQLLDEDFTIYYTSTDESQFFSLYKGMRLPNYTPHSRPWYTQHFLKDRHYPIDYSKPYMNWIYNVYVMSLLINITEVNNQTVGLFGSELYFVKLPLFQCKIPNSNISIIDKKGTIYLSNLDIQNVQKFTNVSFTGFDEDDYTQMMNNLKEMPYLANCTSIKKSSTNNTLCRYNKLYNQDQFITLSKIKDSNLILIIQSDVLHDMDLIDEQVSNTEIRLWNQAKRKEMDLLTLSFCIILSSVFVLMAIFRKLHKITDFVDYRLRSHRYVKEIISFKLEKSKQCKNVLQNLEAAFINLANNMEENQYLQNKTCRKLQYKQQYRKKVRLKYFKQLLNICKQIFGNYNKDGDNNNYESEASMSDELLSAKQYTDSGQVTFRVPL